MYVEVNNYKVSGSVAKQSGVVNVNTDNMKLIIGIRLTVDGKSDTLYDITNDFGRICLTDNMGVDRILQSIGDIRVRPINTYKVMNGIAKENETRYVDFTTVTKITPIKVNNIKGLLYECSSLLNTVLFNTDEKGYQIILKGVGNQIKQIQSCDQGLDPFAVDFGTNDVTDGLTYDLTFVGITTPRGCYTILGDSLYDASDTVELMTSPINCAECRKMV